MCPRMSTHLPRLKEARRAAKGRTRGPDPSLLAIVSAVVHTVIRRATVERRLLEAKISGRKGGCESREGSERTFSFECVAPSVPSADVKSAASEIGKLGRRSRNRRFVNGNPTRAEDLVPMRLTPKWARELT